jgi:hypothetical protein
MGIFNLLAFFMGVYTAQKLKNNEEIKLPNPVEKIEEFRETKEAKTKTKAFDIMLENIDTYDGSDAGQKEIPD